MNFLFVCFSKGLKVIYKLRQSDIRYLRTQAQIRLSLSAAKEDRFEQDKVRGVKSQTHITLPWLQERGPASAGAKPRQGLGFQSL